MEDYAKMNIIEIADLEQSIPSLLFDAALILYNSTPEEDYPFDIWKCCRKMIRKYK